ncbi:hypothetical protein G0029_16950 (plasmid) [Acinetobacter sp. YH12138]|uniref:hypothetical protein n=1 Tax=unclassified Acinetobacter TaxID=196816 RepID=UPI0015D44F2F|nr:MULTISPECIES: hypothetical protein [unclassified Acinetobacter]QOW51462.1 hypothetical protein G0029_16950 [Acinetobacter sp. YH12138]
MSTENQAFWNKIANRSTDIQQQFWYGAEKLAQHIQDSPANYLTYREYDTSKPDPNLSWWEKILFYQGQAAINESVTNHNIAVAVIDKSSWIWGMLKGDFNKNPTMSQIIVSGLISMIPVVDQVCDVRDLIANLIDLSKENGKSSDNYKALALTAFGVIPEIGSAVKTIVKAARSKEANKLKIFKLMEGFESAFKKLKIKSPWNNAPEAWLRSKPWQKMGKTALNALNKCIDRLIQAINGFLNKVRGSLKSALEKFKVEITNAKNAIKKYISDLCNEIQRKFQELLPQPQLGMAGANGANIPTGRYDVNIQSGKSTSTTHTQKEKTPDKEKPSKDKDDPCRLRPYRPDTCGDFGKKGHHVVPDRAFKYGKRSETNKRIPGAISENNGLVVCVTGAGKQLQHGQVHAYYDKKERVMGKTSNPVGGTELWQLEYIAAVSVSKVLKCDRAKMLATLRIYHESMGMSRDFKVRADPSGKLTIDKSHLGKIGTSMKSGGKKL